MKYREISVQDLVSKMEGYDTLTKRYDCIALKISALPVCAGSDTFQNESGKVIGMGTSKGIPSFNSSGV